MSLNGDNNLGLILLFLSAREEDHMRIVMDILVATRESIGREGEMSAVGWRNGMDYDEMGGVAIWMDAGLLHLLVLKNLIAAAKQSKLLEN